MGRPRLSKEREQSAVGRRRGERKRGVRTERPRGSGVRRTGVRRAERGAGAEGQARRARARAACVDGRESVVGEGDRGRQWMGRDVLEFQVASSEVGDYSRNSIKPAAPPAREPYTRRRRVRSIAASHFASMLSSGGRVAMARGSSNEPRWRRVQNLVGTLIC